MVVSRPTSPHDRVRVLGAPGQQPRNTGSGPQQQQIDCLSPDLRTTTSAQSLHQFSYPPSSNTGDVSQLSSLSCPPKSRVRSPEKQTSGVRSVSKERICNSQDVLTHPFEQVEASDVEHSEEIDRSRPPSNPSNGSQIYPSRPKLKSAQSSHLSAPRSVRDLGSDYTRYYNPFTRRKSSDGTLKMPFLASNLFTSSANKTVSSPDLERRLIDTLSRPKTTLVVDVAVSEYATPVLNAEKPSLDLKSCTPSASEDSAKIAEDEALIETPDPVFDSCPPYVDDRLSAPCALPLFTDEKEDDDEMHLPRWDDDIKYNAHWRDRCSLANVINSIGGVLVVLGLMCVFVALPIMSWTGTSILEYPYETPDSPSPEPWTHVNNRKYPLLQNVRIGLIDPDTPKGAMTRRSIDDDQLVLVFSDEFNEQNRTFYPGDDPYWFAPDIWYGATQDLEWYDPDAVNTGGGTLQMQLDEFANHGLDYRSGMLNSWNQLCFKGGVFEVSVSLPGPAGVHGLWPGMWTMGNLGRPGHLSTTDGLWPYTYSTCDVGITPNQSTTDGISKLPGQRLPSCTCADSDHPTPGTGRGAPEIDIAEVSADYGGMGLGVATQSFQVAPFDIWYYPNYDFMELPNYNISFVNTYTGGPYQQAVSTTSMLNNDWYDGKEFQKFAFEYTPGDSSNAGITWFIGDGETMRFDARAIGPNGNVGQRLVSEEPMSIIMNLGFSHSWTYIEFDDLKFPTVLQIDYVRWYQPRNAQIVTCDPPGYETTGYIARHPEAYNNPNYTRWEDTGYDWPRNTLMHDCLA